MVPYALNGYAFLKEAAAILGYGTIFHSGDRTCTEQLGHICAGSGAPTSYHLSGAAFDASIYPANPPVQRYLSWWMGVIGFDWGGNFRKPDPNHYDL